MSFLDWFSSEKSDRETGIAILESYFDEASKFSSFPYGSLDAYVTAIESKIPGYADLLGQIQKANYASVSLDDSKELARELANASGGTAKPQDIMSKTTNSSGINWSAAIPEVTSNTVSDVGDKLYEVAQDVSTGTFGTLKLLKYAPYIVLGGGALYLVFMAKSMGGGIGKSVGRLADAGAERLKKNPRVKRKRQGPHERFCLHYSDKGLAKLLIAREKNLKKLMSDPKTTGRQISLLTKAIHWIHLEQHKRAGKI